MNNTSSKGKEIKIPGPDHPITISPAVGKLRVVVAGQTVAESTRALRLEEKGHPSVPDQERMMAKRAKATTVEEERPVKARPPLRGRRHAQGEAVSNRSHPNLGWKANGFFLRYPFDVERWHHQAPVLAKRQINSDNLAR
jgi:hypothetical protein